MVVKRGVVWVRPGVLETVEADVEGPEVVPPGELVALGVCVGGSDPVLSPVLVVVVGAVPVTVLGAGGVVLRDLSEVIGRLGEVALVVGTTAVLVVVGVVGRVAVVAAELAQCL